MNQAEFLKSVQATILADRLLQRGQGVVIGVSGGPDSMALLHALASLNHQHDWQWTLHVAHLNHGLRGRDSQEDEQFVRSSAEALHLPCFVEAWDAGVAAEQQRQSVEEAARLRRYEFFERVALHTNSRSVAVAHHADDNAETILHRIARGTGFRGLGGIPLARPIRPGSKVQLVRPLLGLRRADVESFLKEAKHPFRTDASNLSGENTRSRIRHLVLPALEQHVHAGAVGALLRLAEQARWLDGYLQQTGQRILDELAVARDDRRLILDANALLAQPRIILTEVLRQGLLAFADPEQRVDESAISRPEIGLEHFTSIIRLIQQGRSGKQVALPGPVAARYEYGRLVLERTDAPGREGAAAQVVVPVPGRVVLTWRGMEIITQLEDFDPSMLSECKATNEVQTEWLDFDRLSLPLVARPPASGERFWPLGAPGSKKLSDFLVDRKVPRQLRQEAIVLGDQEGAIWVIGHRLDERVKLTPATRRVLKLQLRNLSPDSPTAPPADLDHA